MSVLDPDTYPKALFHGWWTRLNCENCEETWDIEDDVTNGEQVECEACGATCIVEGR